MIRAISSPSSSTTGCATLIFAIKFILVCGRTKVPPGFTVAKNKDRGNLRQAGAADALFTAASLSAESHRRGAALRLLRAPPSAPRAAGPPGAPLVPPAAQSLL